MNITLWQGDCLELMKNIPDKSIDMILTDPPYGTTACKWDSVIPFEPMWEQLERIIKDNGAICLFGSEPFSSTLRMSNIKNYKYDWVWEKHRPSNFAQAKRRPLKYHENISVFYKSQPTYNPQMIERKSSRVEEGIKNGSSFHRSTRKDSNEVALTTPYSPTSYTKLDPKKKMPSSILKFPAVVGNSKEKVNHPTQKPVLLLEYLIKTYTIEGGGSLRFHYGFWLNWCSLYKY